MQSHSLSLETLKDNLLHAIDAEYNVTKAEIVLDILKQLEKMNITKDQLQTTRLGWEINTMRQKNIQCVEIARRAKKLLRSWQGLLNTSSVDTKPRLILKVKFNTKRKRKKTQVIEINSNNLLPQQVQMNGSNFLALPFIDCPMEFDLVLDELVV